MKLGFGIYHHMLNNSNFAFARQCGATHLAVHLTDYFYQGKNNKKQKADNQPVGDGRGWGFAGSKQHVWEYEYLQSLKKNLKEHKLKLEAIENFDPAHWYAVLLDLPEKQKQMEKIKQIIKNVGKAGIPHFGYNFSIAGVCSREIKTTARGGAASVVMEEVDQSPIPHGMVWNMTYDEKPQLEGTLKEITAYQLWDRLMWFLKELVPVAQESGVKLCAHPDDPPANKVRQQARLVHTPKLYISLLDIVKSPYNALELCLGTVQEMPDKGGRDIYYWLETYLKKKAVGYIHLRNVKGVVPKYRETFIDEGDIDMKKIIDILRKHKFDGMLIPDHTPQMTCDAPWHAGMAYTMGYIKALLTD